MLHIQARHAGTVTAILLIIVALVLAGLRTDNINPGEWPGILAGWSNAYLAEYRQLTR